MLSVNMTVKIPKEFHCVQGKAKLTHNGGSRSHHQKHISS